MIKAIAICGPTASGKTKLSLELAKGLSGEIISSDSMQIYRGMDVGTAKATAAEREVAPHHMIDLIAPTEQYSVELYRAEAIKIARDIAARGKCPIFVGGTGLYIDSVMRAPIDKAPGSDPEYRERLLRESGGDLDAIWERLYAVDPESAEKIHKNNVKRVIRALEIYETTGIPKSELDKENKSAPGEVSVGMITLDFHDRENLYGRVNLRVDEMMREGLLSEVTSLWQAGLLRPDTTAAQAIGYKEIIEHLEGRATLPEAVEAIKLATRRYAKRQLTWFRHEEGAYTLYVDTEDGKMREFESILEEAMEAARGFLFEKGNFNEG